MRSIITLLSVVCLVLASCAEPTQEVQKIGKAGVISGKFTGIDEGTKIINF